MGIKKRLAWVRCSMGSVASSIKTKVALFHDITKFLTIVDNVAKAFYRCHHWLCFIIIVGQRSVSCAVQGYKIRTSSLKMNSKTVIEMREGLSTKVYRHISQTALWCLLFKSWY